MEKGLDVEKIPEITQLCKIFTRLILWHASDWYFSLIPNSNLIIVGVLYGCQAWQTEEHLTHFFPGWQTGDLSNTFLLKFLSSYFDSVIAVDLKECWESEAVAPLISAWTSVMLDQIWSDYIWHVRMWVQITKLDHMAQSPEKFEVMSSLQILRNLYESFTISWYNQFLPNVCPDLLYQWLQVTPVLCPAHYKHMGGGWKWWRGRPQN